MPTECAHCGQPAGPRFCGHCGRELEPWRGPLLPMVRELLSEWFSLDGRLFKTFGALTRPGRLTRRYLDGECAAYMRFVCYAQLLGLSIGPAVLVALLYL